MECTTDSCDPVEGCTNVETDQCGCTRTIGYYKTHCEELSDIMIGCTSYTGGKRGTLCRKLNQKCTKADCQLVQQLIAAILNGGRNLSIFNISDTISQAESCLCNPNSCSRNQMVMLASQLDFFNNSMEDFCNDN